MEGIEFKEYKGTNIAEAHMYNPFNSYPLGFIEKVFISIEDRKAGSPRRGDMIVRNLKNHDDMWLIGKQYFKDNFEAI